ADKTLRRGGPIIRPSAGESIPPWQKEWDTQYFGNSAHRSSLGNHHVVANARTHPLCFHVLNCESGGIGRRARLRIWYRKVWGFESPLSHHNRRSLDFGLWIVHLKCYRCFRIPKTKDQRPSLVMKTELIDVSPTRKEIKIHIEPQQVREAYDRVSERYAKAASVPGFRKGHAPRSVVRTRFKSEIRGEVLRELVPDAVNGAIGEHSLAAIGEPDIQLANTEGLEKFGEEPITVNVGVEVLPEIQLGQYKGLEV